MSCGVTDGAVANLVWERRGSGVAAKAPGVASSARRDRQPADVCREGGAIGQFPAVGQKRSVQPVGQHDVDGVGHGHVLAVGPSIVQQRGHLRS